MEITPRSHAIYFTEGHNHFIFHLRPWGFKTGKAIEVQELFVIVVVYVCMYVHIHICTYITHY